MNDTRDDNYSSVFDTQLRFGKRPALILIDIVAAYFDKDCPLYADVDAALIAAIALRKTARAAGIPVIYTNVVYHDSMVNAGRFFEKVAPLSVFKQGSPMGDFMPELRPRADELVISKQYPSAFFGTSLASTLTAQGIDTVMLAGLTTSGCVRASCVDSCSHGFTTFVVKDACGDRHAAPHEANLFDMQAKYGQVVSLSEAKTHLSALS